MPTFEDSRDALSGWRKQADENRQRLLLAREGVRRGRRQDADTVARLEGEQREIAARGAQIWTDFAEFVDPRKTLRRLPDTDPILLFPLRLETRFKSSERGPPQLWVRIYPDQCLVDTFEPSLTEKEIENAQAFWSSVWRAGGLEPEEQAAWRDLAASHGAGRAGWIIKHYAPLNPADKLEKNTPSDVLLVIAATDPVPSPAAVFWIDVWRAGGTDAVIVARRPALETAVGAATAAAIIEDFRPFNLGDPPVAPQTRASTDVTVLAVQFTPVAEMDARRSSWSQAPRVKLLPERFLLTAYRGTTIELEATSAPIQTPLVAGPDPNALPADQLAPEGEDLKIPEDIRWMFDFERALEIGMALRIDLTPQQAAAGFDRIVVLGVRVSDTPAEGRKNLEALLEGHLYSRSGLELLPQGTPTNNTEKGSTTFNVHGDPTSAFAAFFKDQPLYTPTGDPLLKSDGQWFAETLSIGQALAERIPNANGRDQIEARAMHLALWPGTIGYMMRTMLAPLFSEDVIDRTRDFLSRYVSGRGWIPALRVGAQPYGVLPVTDFARINWLDRETLGPSILFRDDGWLAYLRGLIAILRRIEADWNSRLASVSFVGKEGGDPQQVLLDVLDLHPASVEFYPLKADDPDHPFYVLALQSFPLALGLLQALSPKDSAMALLRSLGYGGTTEPEALKKLFWSRQPMLTGPIIDTPPVSETDPITNCAGVKNYIEWLVDAARSDFDILQEQTGFDAGKQPSALLYLLLRHALQRGFHHTGVREKTRRGLIVPSLEHYAEPAFVHVRMAQVSESRYHLLHERLPGDIRIADFISNSINLIDPELSEQIAALERLARTPTAALERVFAEHIDCASYRLDAWKQGILHWQLEKLRQVRRGEGGTYLGAYGWLEHVVPENKVFTPVELSDDISAKINKPGDKPLMRDSTNLGLVHAPSLNQVTTAAVLRNGYQSSDGRMAVDLSSRRVRLALGILEGMRNGQSLGALLGYQFERHLHDSNSLSLRALVFGIRRQFPLVANQITTTKDDTKAIEAIAAMNVVDGLKLVRHVEQATVQTYPWGLTTLPAPTDPTHAPAIDAATAHIRDVNDAVADLVLAEGVHQAVLGNYDRSAGVFDAFGKGGFPPEMDVTRTPRSGTALTLRVAIHFDPDAPVNPLAPMPLTPLASAEPGLNAWLKERMPDPADVGCVVTFTDRATGTPQPIFVRQSDLRLHPIDLIYRMQTGVDPSLRFLDERILQFVHTTQDPRIDTPIHIEYAKRSAGNVTFFELQALVNSLHALTVASRPLQPADLARQTDTRAAEQPPVELDAARLTGVRDDLNTTRLTALNALIGALPAGTIDAAIDAYALEVSRLALFRLPQTGIGFAFEWRDQTYRTLATQLQNLNDRWNVRLTDADARLADYDANPGISDEEKRARLAEIEILVSTSYLLPQPPVIANYRNAVGAKRNTFAAEIGTLQGIADTPFPALDAFYQAVKAREPALAAFDLDALKMKDIEGEVTRFRAQLVSTATGLRDDIVKRIAGADDLLAVVPLPIDNLQKAAKILLGDDVQLISHFTLRGSAATDVGNAWTYSRNGDLTRYLRDTIGREYPEDDWLHGIARVRDKLRHFENAMFLAEAFEADPPAPMPIQIPFVPNDSWLALEVPPPANPGGRPVSSDRLLYTAHFPDPFDATRPIAGLLVDEWTEVIPEASETTGVAFHYDRPNSEPPQCWLMVLPAVVDGAWSWEELRDAVTGTLDAARRRAIEPDHIAGTEYSWLLPATYAAYTFPEISISNYLLRNVDIFREMKG
jgi:hypothetical protein